MVKRDSAHLQSQHADVHQAQWQMWMRLMFSLKVLYRFFQKNLCFLQTYDQRRCVLVCWDGDEMN